jgi:hypothetical protein
LGYSTADIPYIGLAEKLGVGSADLSKALIRGLNAPDGKDEAGKARVTPAASPGAKVRQLAQYIHESDACSACYAGLVFGLSRMESPALARLRGKVAVGQGFRGKKGAAGIGRCTGAFDASCPGCPPAGAEVLAFLKGLAAR